MIWTDDADRLLIHLWNKGGTLRSMAADMQAAGYDLTRNSIAGRKSRLPNAAFTLRLVPGTRRPKTARRPQRSKPVDEKSKKPPLTNDPPVPVEPPFDLSTWEGIPYLELKSDGCKAVMDERGRRRARSAEAVRQAAGHRHLRCPLGVLHRAHEALHRIERRHQQGGHSMAKAAKTRRGPDQREDGVEVHRRHHGKVRAHRVARAAPT